MAIKVDEVIKHFENLYSSGAIYLWGSNSEVITLQLCNKLYNTFKSSTYNKAYYQKKYNEGKGKIGADCSGAFYPVSGFDATAQGYYNKCIEQGNISVMPKDKPCLVFKGKSTSKITHIGFYCGNGQVIEMKSSKENCVKDKLAGKGWQWYGIPDWIDYSEYIYSSDFEPYLAKTTSDLNLRSTPSSTYRTNVIVVIPKDTYVSVINASVGYWVYVQFVAYGKEYTGYVSSKYLYTFDTSNREKRQVTAPGLNARAGQGTTHHKIFTMKKNDVFTVVNKEKWGLILYDNKLGYANVSNAYSKKL